MAKFIMTVRSNPVPGREAEYNEWYDRFHVPELVMTPTFVAGQRYRLADVKPFDYPGYQKPEYSYMVVYEIETDNLQKTKEILWSPENIGRIQKSTAFDSSKVDCQLYTPVGPRVLSPK